MTTPHTTIKPISDYAAILTEMEHWKEKFYDLQAQISEIRQTGTDTIIIKEGGTARYIRLADIIMMQADSNYTTIHLANGEKILTSKTLKYWEAKVKIHTDFIRPHRSYLVNKTHILSYQRSTNRLLLVQGQEIQVARRYKLV
ncbi:MAG: LytTR family transcriptional regulator [Saprospiraceae bacterium]|nr:LytTR family transcriptional regulator [Saprospiraceae bacterium]